MSRLARSSKDWHHLLELSAVFGSLLADQEAGGLRVNEHLFWIFKLSEPWDVEANLITRCRGIEEEPHAAGRIATLCCPAARHCLSVGNGRRANG